MAYTSSALVNTSEGITVSWEEYENMMMVNGYGTGTGPTVLFDM